MKTDTLVAVEKISGAKIEFLGSLLWYTITDCRITGPEIARLFRESGLSSSFLPRPINIRDAFRRSTKVAEVVKRPVNGDNKKYLNLLVREVKMDQDAIVRQLVREIVDSKNKRLQYKPVLSIALSGENLIFDALTELIEPEIAAIDKINESFEVNKEKYEGSHIRNIVNNILTSCSKVAVRPSGGVFFIPAKHDNTVEAVKSFINKLNPFSVSGFVSQAFSVPVINAEEQREMVKASLEEQVKAESEILIREMKERLSSSAKITSRIAASFVERVKYLQNLVTEYKEYLELESSRAESVVEIAMRQATVLLESI